MPSELRKDPLLGRWVAIASNPWGPERYEFFRKRSEESSCALCSFGRSDKDNPVPHMQNPVAMLESKGDVGRRGAGMYDMMNSFGVNEIIIESQDHDTPPENVSTEHLAKVIKRQIERAVAIEKDERIRYVLIYKDSMMLSGSVNYHPHSEIIATPIIPMRIKAELDGAKEYYAYKERCIFCDIIDEETRVQSRVIAQSEGFIAFAPFASKFPFEFCIIPKRHSCSYRDASGPEIFDLAGIMQTVLAKMKSVLGDPSYSYVIHSAPARIPRRSQWHTLGDDYHWHIEVVPRLIRALGVEWGSGFYVNPTPPEAAAGYLRI